LNDDARARALERLLADPALRRTYKKLVAEEQRAIQRERAERELESRRTECRSWIGHALEALVTGDVEEYAGAVDLAYSIAQDC